MAPKINQIFFSRYETAGSESIARCNDVLHVIFLIGVVIAKFDLSRRDYTCRADLREKLLRTRNSAKNYGEGGAFWIAISRATLQTGFPSISKLFLNFSGIR